MIVTNANCHPALVAGSGKANNYWKILSLFSILFYFIIFPAHAQNNVKASLVTEAKDIVAGQPLKVGLKLEAGDWHTYYKDPGDAGLPTTLEWTLPEGFVAGEIEWPEPKKFSEGDLTTYGYTGTTTLPVTIKTPSNLAAASYDLKVKAKWLACKEICIPESAELSLTLPVSAVKTTENKPEAASELDSKKKFQIQPIR